MKAIAILTLFIFNSYYSTGQTYRPIIDSLTQKRISELPNDLQQIFNPILNQSYQIVTLVNRIEEKVIVSFQTPPENPKVTLRYLYQTNDW